MHQNEITARSYEGTNIRKYVLDYIVTAKIIGVKAKFISLSLLFFMAKLGD